MRTRMREQTFHWWRNSGANKKYGFKFYQYIGVVWIYFWPFAIRLSNKSWRKQ